MDMKSKVITIISLIVGICLFFTALVFAGAFDDETPPLVICYSPGEGDVINGEVVLSFGVGDSQSRIREVLVAVDDKEYPVEAPDGGFENYHRFSISLDTTRLYDGDHRLRFVAITENEVCPRTEIERSVFVDNIPFEVELIADRTEVPQGNVFSVVLLPTEPAVVREATFNDRDITFYPFGNGYKAIVNVRASADTGVKVFEYLMENEFGEEWEGSLEVEVSSAGFLSEYIQLPPDKSKPFPEERRQREYQMLKDELLNPTDKQLWKGFFEVPVEGRLTSYFGTFRKYSTGATGQHLGVDLACDEGTPIYSPNQGEVRIAQEFCVRGNFVMIDHGRGVYSLLNHLSEITVEEGDEVEKGDIVGYVGDTGLATGPHLHWEMRVGRWVVNPYQWTEEEFTY